MGVSGVSRVSLPPLGATHYYGLVDNYSVAATRETNLSPDYVSCLPSSSSSVMDRQTAPCPAAADDDDDGGDLMMIPR